MPQTTPHVLMIRPAAFGFNPETAASNSFQTQKIQSGSFQEAAAKEFDAFAAKLQASGVDVYIEKDTPEPIKPDALFPNNWLSTHDSTIVTWPMEAPIRQQERRADIVLRIQKKYGFQNVLHLENYETSQQYLEGTGSIVFDHKEKYAFACLSSRTHLKPLQDFCDKFGYQPVTFTAQFQGTAIYHTNVMLSIGEKYAVVCSASISDGTERQKVLSLLKKIRPVVIDVTLAQMQQFSCNILELQSQAGVPVLAMSQTAYASFEPEQMTKLNAVARVVSSPLDTIEKIGGGSARCMLAEIFA